MRCFAKGRNNIKRRLTLARLLAGNSVDRKPSDGSARHAEVEALSGFRLRVRFNDGTAGIVEMAEFVKSDAAGIFAALRDERLFRQARIIT
jgi:hypothetical protein